MKRVGGEEANERVDLTIRRVSSSSLSPVSRVALSLFSQGFDV
jgi:hypothetical protein